MEKLLNVCLNVHSEEGSAVALVGFPVRTHQELLKVPGDIISTHWTPDDELGISHEGRGIIAGEGKLLLQKGEQGVAVGPVHIQLLKELELRFKAIPWTDVLQGS